jgi:serine/threonine protein kinase
VNYQILIERRAADAVNGECGRADQRMADSAVGQDGRNALQPRHRRAGPFDRRSSPHAPQQDRGGSQRIGAMALDVGSRLGHYEIVSIIGAGGMGVVYSARDTKLGRQVALKILPPAFASDAEYVARFDREGRLLAAVNHPNIATLYGLEETPGMTALVMELVDGRNLAECIAEGGTTRGRPIETAVALARQIADAVAAAHERGIVHRDLKPSNIKITPEGVVKILDFGLAKHESTSGPESGPGGVDLTGSPTVMPSATRAGMILGTAAYMSPEQARGLPVDHRTDIWAFGCMLFEMLTGRPPFDGDTVSDVIASILRRDPEWTALPEALPPSLHRVLRRCLAKDLRRRFHAMADVRLEVEESEASGQETLGATPAVHVKRDLEFQRITDFVGSKEAPVVSPDGKMVVFVVALLRAQGGVSRRRLG